MKHLATFALLAPLCGCVLPAQEWTPAPPPPPSGTTTVVTTSAPTLFTAEQLDTLLASIALYPDPLLAIMLPASTSPSDIVLAARYLQAGGDPNQADSQPWEDSVRSLAHYPQLIRWMDENLAWTQQLGDAFAAQPSDVMSAIQRLRARAYAAGTLRNTPQQVVVIEGSTIAIAPANPSVVYIPYYDPAVVYVPQRVYYDYPYDPFFNFSVGFASGWWLSYGLDWPRHRVWAVDRDDRERYWREHHNDWHRPPTWRGPSAPPVHDWRPRTEPRGREWPHRPPHVTPPGRTDRDDDRRGDRSSRNGTTTVQNIVGPRANLGSPLPQPLPTPRNAPPLPSYQGPDFRNRGQDRGRNDDSARRAAPATPVRNQSPMVGPTAPPPAQSWQQQRLQAPPSSGSAAIPAEPPRQAPPMPRYTPPAMNHPQPAPPMPRYAAPAPQAQPAPPPPQQQPQQQQQQQQQSSQSQGGDDRGRPPWIRQR